jgi:hypothetical protein
MPNIRETVHNAMRDQGLYQYTGQAEPVIAALERREDEIVQNLTTFAVEQGLSRDKAMQALSNCGLNGLTTPAPAEDPRIAQIERQIAEAQDTLRLIRDEG